MKEWMIRIGNFFFRYRNRAFPTIILILYLMAAPAPEMMGSSGLEETKDILALLIACAGLALRALVIGYAYIKRGGLNKKVYAENLVTEGVFAICRNPLYVGNVLIYLGVFLMHGNPWVMLLGCSIFFFIYQCIIYAEEAFLENKFGEGYRDYCREVPRWIPQFSKLKEATQGMSFNIRRVIIKDYTTIATTVIALAVTEGYEYIALANPEAHGAYIALLAGIVGSALVMVLTVRVLKKRKWLTENAPV